MSNVTCDDIFSQCLRMLEIIGEYDPNSPFANRYEPIECEETLETIGVKYVKDGNVCFEYYKQDILFAYICHKDNIK